MKAEDLQPLDDRVVVEPEVAAEVTAGGLFIPEVARDKPQRGWVVAAGPGHLTDQGVLLAMPVKPGDEIVFGKFAGSEILVDREPVLIVRATDILAIIHTESNGTA